MFLLSLKFDIMREVVLGSDLHTRHACQDKGKPSTVCCGQTNQPTIAVFLMASPVTIPAKPALLITCKNQGQFTNTILLVEQYHDEHVGSLYVCKQLP